jgi:two-component system, sensor histidine kinase
MTEPNKTLQVLIADDDPIQRSIMASRLAKLNATTVEADDGDVAWQLMSSGQFDLAIVDLGMPRFGGIELTQCIRGHPRTRHIPVIVVTSHDDRDSINAAFAAGASSFLVKPVVWSTFEHHIGFLLRLVNDARTARSLQQVDVATHKAKQLVLGTLSSGAKSAAQKIITHVNSLKAAYGSAPPNSPLQIELSNISDACQSLLAGANTAVATLDVLTNEINVSDHSVDLDVVLQNAIEAVSPAAVAKGQTISVSLPTQHVALSCDQEAVSLALAHLLSNAITHSEPNRTITIRANCYPDGLIGIEIIDQGCGIHHEDLARILSPLGSDLDHAPTIGHVGTGLPLAKAIAEAHNGRLELRSMPGHGTTALFTLPPDRVFASAVAA